MFTAALAPHRCFALIVCLLLASGPAAARAQFEFPSGLSGLGGVGNSGEVTFEGQFAPAEADRPALLFVTAQISAAGGSLHAQRIPLRKDHEGHLKSHVAPPGRGVD